MINFNAPPKKRVAAALKGFGFGTVRSTTQHLRGLGLTIDPTYTQVTRSIATVDPTAAPAPTLAYVPRTPVTRGEVAPTLTYVPRTPVTRGSVAPALTYVPRTPVTRGSVAPTLTYVPRTPVTRGSLTPQARVEEPVRFAPGTEGGAPDQGDASAPPSDIEEPASDSNYSESDNGGGGGDQYAQGTPGDGSSATDTNQKKIVVTGTQAIQSQGFMAQISALPLPVKVLGGAALVYIAWQVFK